MYGVVILFMSILGVLNCDFKESHKTLENMNSGCNLHYQTAHANAEGLCEVSWVIYASIGLGLDLPGDPSFIYNLGQAAAFKVA